jgi:hypothetical protein
MSKFETYTLPEHWASALINDDESGLSDSESEELKQWLADTNPGYCVSVDSEPVFTRYHDAPGTLACNCLKFTFQNVGE